MNPAAPFILIANTCDGSRGLLKYVLETAGGATREATTRHEALERVSRDLIAVIVSGLHFPDGNWKDILSDLAVVLSRPHVVVSSAAADDRFRAEVLMLGGFGVVAEPFDEEEVLRVVMGARRAWQQECEAAVSDAAAKARSAGFRAGSRSIGGGGYVL